MNATSNSFEGCSLLLSTESPQVKALVVLAHLPVLLLLLSTVQDVYQKVQVAHPVFAVVFQVGKRFLQQCFVSQMVLCKQDLVVLSIGCIAECATLLHVLTSDNEVWVIIGSMFATVVMQFHQLSWLVVTLLR